MQRIMLKSKIHRATVTGLELDYEGSIAIDPLLLEAADILPGEQVQVLNINNGERFITYAILGRRGSGQMMLNGPAARLAYRGHHHCGGLCRRGGCGGAQIQNCVVKVDAKNRVVRLCGSRPGRA